MANQQKLTFMSGLYGHWMTKRSPIGTDGQKVVESEESMMSARFDDDDDDDDDQK